MNKRAFLYLGLLTATLATAFFYVQWTSKSPKDTPSAHTVSAESAQALPLVTVHRGVLTTAPLKLQITQGQTARFLVRCDVADELHVPGTSISTPLKPHQTTRIQIPAQAVQTMQLVLKNSGVSLGTLTVKDKLSMPHSN